MNCLNLKRYNINIFSIFLRFFALKRKFVPKWTITHVHTASSNPNVVHSLLGLAHPTKSGSTSHFVLTILYRLVFGVRLNQAPESVSTTIDWCLTGSIAAGKS